MGALLNARKARSAATRAVLSALVLVMGLLMITPFLFMLSASFKHPGLVFVEPLRLIPRVVFLGNFQRVFADRLYPLWYWNSIRIVLLTIPLRGFVVSLAAYAFARLRFRGKNLLFLLFMATMMITPEATLVPRYLLYKAFGLIDNQWAIIVPAVFDVFFLFMLRQFFMTVPRELSEAAFIDGYGHLRIYWRILLPLSKPALITMVLFTFIWIWNDYANPFVFINSMKKQLITTGLQFFQSREGANYALQMAGATFAVIPTVVLFTFTQRYFVQGIATSGIKG
ncbi:MAG: carbohydrate ABC transporter permease [Acidobacteria bacterium]|jgi:multiple sugar transport system permease protein|nr:carbohydrate ABC transporter permease [Acidobacteriota bacterium]